VWKGEQREGERRRGVKDAPTVRTAAPAPAARVPSTTSLAQTLSDWDDE
jgi:hypothetical protein